MLYEELNLESLLSTPRKDTKDFLIADFIFAPLFMFSVEHPAAGYKKIFETVEELNEPVTAKISGRKMFLQHFHMRR